MDRNKGVDFCLPPYLCASHFDRPPFSSRLPKVKFRVEKRMVCRVAADENEKPIICSNSNIGVYAFIPGKFKEHEFPPSTGRDWPVI